MFYEFYEISNTNIIKHSNLISIELLDKKQSKLISIEIALQQVFASTEEVIQLFQPSKNMMPISKIDC